MRNLINKVQFSVIVSALVSVASASEAFAQAPNITIGPTFVTTSFCNAVGWMFFILVTICTIMILWAGYLFATAGDDTEKVHLAKQTLLYAAIGVLVALVAKAFPQSIAGILQLQSGTGGC